MLRPAAPSWRGPGTVPWDVPGGRNLLLNCETFASRALGDSCEPCPLRFPHNPTSGSELWTQWSSGSGVPAATCRVSASVDGGALICQVEISRAESGAGRWGGAGGREAEQRPEQPHRGRRGPEANRRRSSQRTRVSQGSVVSQVGLSSAQALWGGLTGT